MVGRKLAGFLFYRQQARKLRLIETVICIRSLGCSVAELRLYQRLLPLYF